MFDNAIYFFFKSAADLELLFTGRYWASAPPLVHDGHYHTISTTSNKQEIFYFQQQSRLLWGCFAVNLLLMIAASFPSASAMPLILVVLLTLKSWRLVLMIIVCKKRYKYDSIDRMKLGWHSDDTAHWQLEYYIWELEKCRANTRSSSPWHSSRTLKI